MHPQPKKKKSPIVHEEYPIAGVYKEDTIVILTLGPWVYSRNRSSEFES